MTILNDNILLEDSASIGDTGCATAGLSALSKQPSCKIQNRYIGKQVYTQRSTYKCSYKRAV